MIAGILLILSILPILSSFAVALVVDSTTARRPLVYRRTVLIGAALLGGGVGLPAQGTRLLRHPTVSRELVAFRYAGDLWSVPRTGGQARRLTATPAVETDPRFSPDGSQIAFTATVGGNTDVYVMPTGGGDPTRLTYHP